MTSAPTTAVRPPEDDRGGTPRGDARAAGSRGPARARAAATLVLPTLAALLLLPRAGASQEARTVTYEEAVRLALQRNTTISRAESQVGLQSSLATGETLDFLPDLQLSTSGTRTFGRSFSQEEGAILSETSDFFGASISSSLTLFNGFEQFASLERAQREEEASRRRLGRAEQDIAFQVLDRFATLLQNRELTRVAEQELTTQEELLRQVRGLVDVGRQPQSDLYQQQAARAEARAALEEARRQEEVAKTELVRLLQLDPRREYEFVASTFPDAVDARDEVAADTFELDRLLDAAMERRSDLAAGRSAVEAGRQGVREAQSGYWPSLTLSFSYGSDWSSTARQPVPGTGSEPREITVLPEGESEPVTFPIPGTETPPEFVRPDFTDQLDARRGGSVRLSLSYPLFQRWQIRNQVRQARVQLDNARYDLTDQEQTVALEVRQALVDYRSSRAQLDAAEERLEAARRARDAARRRYELGAATFVEVTQAISGFVAASSAEVQARYALVRARELIDYQTGRLSLRPGAPEGPEGP